NMDSGYLVHRRYMSGGSYGATQPGFVGFFSDQIMVTKGQNIGFQMNGIGYGVGNTMWGGGLMTGWGGAGVSDVTPGSVPLIGSEFDYYVGSASANASIFSATVSGVASSTLTYSSATNEGTLGERWFLIPARKFTGTAVSIAGQVITVNAGDTLTSSMVGRYLALGDTDAGYAPACGTYAAEIDGTCWPLFYRITAIDNTAHTITLGMYPDVTNYPTSGNYVIINGALGMAVDAVGKTVTVDNATALGAQVGDTVLSPPNPWQSLTDQRVYRHFWPIGRNSLNSGAYTFNNLGALKDTLFHVQGPWRTLMRGDTFSGGVDLLDFHNMSATHSSLWVAQSDGTSNRICFGNSTCDAKVYWDGTKLALLSGASGAPILFGDAAGDWVFQIQRLAAGIVAFGNSDANDYGAGVDGVWLKRSAGLGGAIWMYPGTAGLQVGAKVVAPTVQLSATLFAALGTPADGTILYCSDCTVASPCAGSGTGALAKRLAGAWVCN
ncbi:MAG: hypothetical protein ACRD3E_11075, partial [Terriglobales bacterium]